MGKETPKRPDGIPDDVWADAGTVAREWMVEQARRLGLNSGNSSMPPSSDGPADELLGEDFSGVVGADRYSAYAAIPEDRRQFCWAHLLRDFQAMIDRGGASESIGRRLKTSGQELIHHWNRLCDEQIKQPTFDTHYHRLRSDIVKALGDGAVCTDTRTARNVPSAEQPMRQPVRVHLHDRRQSDE